MVGKHKQQKPLTELTGLSRRKIIHILIDLEKMGIIEIKRDDNGKIHFNENGDIYVKPVNKEQESG
jgi:predicted transcriptional regulator